MPKKKTRKRVVDPTKTTTLRNRLVSKIKGRANKLKASIRRYIITQDALLLTDNRLRVFAEIIQPGDSPTVKVLKFKEWLQEQIQADFLQLDSTGSLVEVVNSDINEAFLKGREMGKSSVQSLTGDVSDSLTRSTRTAGGLSSAFGPAQVSVEEMELIFNTVRDNLINLSEDMASKAAGAVSRGLIAGLGPRDVARNIIKEIDIQANRAIMTARTEMIRGHHIGNIGEMRAAGLEDVTVLAEWSTAKDGRVCQSCVRLEGRIFTIDEIAGLIPLHTNCRCSAIPILPGITPTSGRPTKEEMLKWTAPSAKTKTGKLKPTDIPTVKPSFSDKAAEKRQVKQAQNEQKFDSLQQELNSLFADLSENSESQQQDNQALILLKLFAQNKYLHEKQNLILEEKLEALTAEAKQSLYMMLRPHAKQGEQGDSVQGDKGDQGDSIQGEKGDKGDAGDSIQGLQGIQGKTPGHKYNLKKNTICFKKANGDWGTIISLAPIPGKPGKDATGKPGKDGLPPEHEVVDNKLRLRQPNGEWGEWIEPPESVKQNQRLHLTNKDIRIKGNRIEFFVNGKWSKPFIFGGDGGSIGTLQGVTEEGNTTTKDIIQLGGKIVAPEFESSGGSFELSQKVKFTAFGTLFSISDNLLKERYLNLKLPYDDNGTSQIQIPILNKKITIVSQPIFTDLFEESSLTQGIFTGTANFITDKLIYRFQDAGKVIKLRTIANNGVDTFDLFGTSVDPFKRFISKAGLTEVILENAVPSLAGIDYFATLETEDGSPLNILGLDTGLAYATPLGNTASSDFNPYLEAETFPSSEDDLRALDIVYVPTTPENWDDPDPENIREALDIIAANDRDKKSAIDNSISATSSSTYQTKLTLSTGNKSGDYKIFWTVTLNNNISVGQVRLENVTDTITIGESIWSSRRSQQKEIITGFDKVTLDGVSKDYSIQWKSESGNHSQIIRDARIMLERWEE